MQIEAGPEIGVFQEALTAFNEAGLPYVIGGAFAVYHYTGTWRNTNDMDVYVERIHVPSAVLILTESGFQDAGQQAAGDRTWIYHGTKHKILVDVIWGAPNGVMRVTEDIHKRGSEGTFLGIPTRFIPADDLVLAKIYTMNQHRCDWPDVIRIIRACHEQFDWRYVLDAMGENWPVLLSFIILFDWLYPNHADCIPMRVRQILIRRKSEEPMPLGGSIHESVLDPWIYTRPLSV